MKRCTKCGIEKEIKDFYSQKGRKDGLHSECKKCAEIRMAAYRQKNVEQIKIQRAAYYQKNVEQIKIRDAAYYQKNVEQIKICMAAYYQKNVEQIKIRLAAYYQKNPDPYIRRANIRKRELGWIPLNEPTEGYEAHHIGKDYVIFIPHDIHRSIYHNQKTGKGMDKINEIAFAYLLPGVRCAAIKER